MISSVGAIIVAMSAIKPKKFFCIILPPFIFFVSHFSYIILAGGENFQMFWSIVINTSASTGCFAESIEHACGPRNPPKALFVSFQQLAKQKLHA